MKTTISSLGIPLEHYFVELEKLCVQPICLKVMLLNAAKDFFKYVNN